MPTHRSRPRNRRSLALAPFALALALASPSFARAELLPGFVEAPQFQEQEQERWTRLDSGIRIYLNAPRDVPAADRTLVVYATPNACTIEQTLGCAKTEGLPWRFDIQHVAGQVRRLREVGPQLNPAALSRARSPLRRLQPRHSPDEPDHARRR